MLPLPNLLNALGLAVERLTEHVKRLHCIKIQQTVEMGTPLSSFIRPTTRTYENAMSLEQKIEALTAAVEALTAQMKLGGTGTTPSVGKDKEVAAPAPAPKAAKAKAEPAEPAGPSIEDMKAVVTQVKDKHGTPVAKELIKKYGKADKLADVTDPKLVKALHDAAQEKLGEEDAEETDDDV